MAIFKSNKPYQPAQQVIVFSHDQNEKNYAGIYEIERIENGRIITVDEELVLPLEDAQPFTLMETSASRPGICYAYNCSLEYLKEIQHLGEVERNIIIQQAFLYPGQSIAEQKSNMMTYVIISVLGIITLISLFN